MHTHLMTRLLTLLVCFFLSTQALTDSSSKVVHVFVALADNDSQGIVPVPGKLGNGNDARNNLYWSALYGIKTHFKKSALWSLRTCAKSPSENVLERCIFKHNKTNTYLVADAYKGVRIKAATAHFLTAAGGDAARDIRVDAVDIATHGSAQMAVYIGHKGLMDFDIEAGEVTPGKQRLDGTRGVYLGGSDREMDCGKTGTGSSRSSCSGLPQIPEVRHAWGPATILL